LTAIRSGRPEASDHVGIEPEAHQTLGALQARSAAQPAVEVDCIGGRIRSGSILGAAQEKTFTGLPGAITEKLAYFNADRLCGLSA
jgi:hypothetical protein